MLEYGLVSQLGFRILKFTLLYSLKYETSLIPSVILFVLNKFIINFLLKQEITKIEYSYFKNKIQYLVKNYLAD